jgi:hypothetical protein
MAHGSSQLDDPLEVGATTTTADDLEPEFPDRFDWLIVKNKNGPKPPFAIEKSQCCGDDGQSLRLNGAARGWP